MDVQTNEVLLEGLGMPHSPVWSEDEGCLHFLESAKGSVTRYFPETGAVETAVQTDRFCVALPFTRAWRLWVSPNSESRRPPSKSYAER